MGFKKESRAQTTDSSVPFTSVSEPHQLCSFRVRHPHRVEQGVELRCKLFRARHAGIAEHGCTMESRHDFSQSKLDKNQISNIYNVMKLVSARLAGRGTLNPTCYTMAMDRMCTGISSIRRWAKVEGAQLGEGRTVGGGQ